MRGPLWKMALRGLVATTIIGCGSSDFAIGGPSLTASATTLRAAMTCPSDLRTAQRQPLLLIHGTALDTESNFSWNWIPALAADGRPYCTLDLVDFGLGDIQDSAERVVFAIREMAQLSGQRVQIVGYSQGGLVPRWALKYWPDTRALVEDLITLSGSHHGTVVATPVCLAPCAPSIWQQDARSNLLAALNADGVETFAEVDYTSIYTLTDEVVFPNLFPDSASSTLRNGGDNVVNIPLQSICQAQPAEHLLIGTANPLAWRLALDALDHSGPADPARIDASVCAEVFMPGVTPATFALDFASVGQTIADSLLFGLKTDAEPPLRCYATGSC